MRILTAAATSLILPCLLMAAASMEEISRDKILGAGAEWQEKYDKFQAEQDLLDALKSKIGPNLKVDVYLGLWCPDSRNNVPRSSAFSTVWEGRFRFAISTCSGRRAGKFNIMSRT